MNKNFSLAIVLLLVAAAQSFSIVQDTTADDRVKVDFYF